MKYHILFAVLCISIFIESSFPSDSFPDKTFELEDKFVHFAIYFVLSVSAFLSFIRQKKINLLRERALVSIVIFTLIYGGLDEIHQYFVPGRSCDFYDWLANIAGSVFAVLAIIILKKLFTNNNNIFNSDYDTN